MKTYDPYKPLISIHIPKCAGSSFSKVLENWYGAGFRRHYFHERKNRPPKKHALYSGLFRKKPVKGLCIHGHFNNARGIGILDYYPDADQIITVIRHPFDLHLSNYFFLKRLSQDEHDDIYRDGKIQDRIISGMSLEDYLEQSTQSYLCNFFPADITLDNYRQVMDERYLFIGISGKLQETVNVLAHILGYPALQVPDLNRSERDEPVPEGALEQFISNNPLEMAIYEYALGNFERELSP